METNFQSTFIPRGPMAPVSAATLQKNSKKSGLLGFLAFIIFALSLLITVGVYGYEKYQVSHIAKMGKELEAARQSLEADALNQVMRLNSRIESTQKIVDSHTAMSPLFDFLEANTVKSLRFTDFGYKQDSEGIKLNLKGQARGYSALALQAELFNKSKYIRNPVFTDLRLDEKGNVNFSFNADLDKSIISYKNPPQIGAPAIPSGTLPATTTSTSTSIKTGTSTNPR
jgi:hypothetical protein